MRLLAALCMIVVMPPILAGVVAYPFAPRAYVFIAAFLCFTVVSIPYASAIADGRALADSWRTGLHWLAWYAAAAAGFASVICLMLLSA